MQSKTMHQLAKLATNRPNLLIAMTHRKRLSRYRVIGYIEVDINDVWVQHIAYVCLDTNKLYSRLPTNFKNFNEVTM